MDKIILGLLLIKEMSGYEMRLHIKSKFALMCSDSAGSLQTSLKKLLKGQLIQCNEFVENGKNKKVYSITDKGKTEFLLWESKPMNHKKSKNIELSKLFFLGLLKQKQRIPLLKEYVAELHREKADLEVLQKATHAAIASNKGLTEEQQELIKYQLITLNYGIAAADFEIQWYGRLINNTEREQ